MGRQVLSESLLGPQVQPRTPSGVSGPGFQLSRPRARGPGAGPESDVLSLAAPASPCLTKPWALLLSLWDPPTHTYQISFQVLLSSSLSQTLAPQLRLGQPSCSPGPHRAPQCCGSSLRRVVGELGSGTTPQSTTGKTEATALGWVLKGVSGAWLFVCPQDLAWSRTE